MMSFVRTGWRSLFFAQLWALAWRARPGQTGVCAAIGMLAFVTAADLSTLLVTAAEDAPALAGVYRDEQVTVELKRADQGGPGSYAGVIELGDQKFPLKAQAEGSRLQGTFESQGMAFKFNASVGGHMLVLTTDGTTYRLTRQTSNPLARLPSKPNPLARPPAAVVPSAVAPAAVTPAVPPPRATVAVPAPSVTVNTLRLGQYSVMDGPGVIGGEAFSMLVPADWQVEGGLAWRGHPTVPAYLAMRVSSPDRIESVEIFPTLMFIWAEGGIPLFPPGSNYLGNEVGEPIEDPVTYITAVVLPRFRKNLPLPQVSGTEELPKVAEAVAENAQEPGLQKKFRAARVRLEYQEGGKAMQEDIYCVLASAYAPSIHTTFWGPDRNYAFKAEKGKLDGCAKLLQTIVGSIRPNLTWFNRYVQLIQVLGRSQTDLTPHLGEFGRIARTATTDQVTDLRRQAYARQQVSQERINSSFIQYFRGLEEYRHPLEKRVLVLPAYPGVWFEPRGDCLLVDDASFNPNRGEEKAWKRAQVNR